MAGGILDDPQLIADSATDGQTVRLPPALMQPIASDDVAATLAAIAVQFVAPDSFTLTLSIGLLVGLVIGGLTWLPGAFIGGAFVLFVPNVAESISKGLSGAVYGVILFIVIYLAPFGTGGLLVATTELIKKWRK